MQKTIEVTIKLTSDTTFDMEFHEPESGDFNRWIKSVSHVWNHY